MIIVDSELKRRELNGNPIRVAMMGAGYMGQGIALQIRQYMTGMQLVAIANRTLSAAIKAYQDAGAAVSGKITILCDGTPWRR